MKINYKVRGQAERINFIKRSMEWFIINSFEKYQ